MFIPQTTSDYDISPLIEGDEREAENLDNILGSNFRGDESRTDGVGGVALYDSNPDDKVRPSFETGQGIDDYQQQSFDALIPKESPSPYQKRIG